jgi:hypothetical protein
MKTNYRIKEITNVLVKLFDAGYNTEKKIMLMKMEDLTKVKNLKSDEALLIIELQKAIKNKDLIAFFSEIKTKIDKQRKGDEVC